MIEFNSQFYAVIKEQQQKELTKNIHNDFVRVTADRSKNTGSSFV